MDRIKYFCYYDTIDAPVERGYVLAATNKLDYIWKTLNNIGYSVDVISVSCCTDTRWIYASSGIKQIGEFNTLRLFPSFGGPKVIRILGRYYLWACFFLWFILNVGRGEKVVVYHSLGYCRLLMFLQFLTGCKIIGEIEEIYQDVLPQKKSVKRAEKNFIKKCDAYIFPTHLLDQNLNPTHKPSVLVHGIYEVEKPRNCSWNDSDIHVVYAGTFDPSKGGALAAVTSAKFLPKGYHLHVCGFGTEHETLSIRDLIEKINSISEATVTYDGLMKGEEFIEFLQKCKIGLSTQNPTAAFNSTSFPSKVLTYLANGLRVVTIRIPVLELSRIGAFLFYYDKQSPKEIAMAIMDCAHVSHSLPPNEVLNRLDVQFKCDLARVLKHV